MSRLAPIEVITPSLKMIVHLDHTVRNGMDLSFLNRDRLPPGGIVIRT